MHDAGARVFVEVGPQAVLTGLATQILAGRPHVALASDTKSRPGLVQLTHLLGQLFAAGVTANLDRLFAGRATQPFELAKLNADTGKPTLAPTTWVVNGVRSRPLNGPEPRCSARARAESPVPAPLPEGKGEKIHSQPSAAIPSRAPITVTSSSSPPSGRGAEEIGLPSAPAAVTTPSRADDAQPTIRRTPFRPRLLTGRLTDSRYARGPRGRGRKS